MGVGRHVPPDAGRVSSSAARARRRARSVADPYFGGAGPDRSTCIDCGECMTGCRHNAKNTLVKNYLYLAESHGATVHAAHHGDPDPAARRRRVRRDVRYTKAKRATARTTRTLTADHVVLAAASLGTQKLLHRMKAEGHLPQLSDRLGYLSRTNSESILGAIAPDV